MKIVYVSDTYYPYFKGGKEKRLHELSTRLAKLGHEVHVYTMHWWDGPRTKQVDNGVTLHAVCPVYPLYKGDKRSIREGVMFSLACLKLWKVRWDVLDVDHMPFFPIYAAWVICLLRGRRRSFYGTWHEALSRKDWTDYMGVSGNIAALIERISIKLPAHITAASLRTKHGLEILHRRSRNVELVTPGIDVKLLSSVKAAASSTDVLYVGRLVKDKNVDQLIAAISVLKQKRPDISCTIIGNGIEHENLVSQIRQADLDDTVQLLDPLATDTAVYAYMKAARVFCLPSIREGFGMVVLESLGCGTPVVTVDSPANASKDLVQDGVNGSVVPLTADDLAAAIEHWLGSPRPSNLAAGIKGYDWSLLADRQAEVYGA